MIGMLAIVGIAGALIIMAKRNGIMGAGNVESLLEITGDGGDGGGGGSFDSPVHNHIVMTMNPVVSATMALPTTRSTVLYDLREFAPETDFPEGECAPFVCAWPKFTSPFVFWLGIFSYASRSDGGNGIDHMWAIGNALRVHKITTYCGLMVRTDNWQEKWFGAFSLTPPRLLLLSLCFQSSRMAVVFSRLSSDEMALSLSKPFGVDSAEVLCVSGKLNKAKFAIIMLSDAYWQSGPCIEEVRAILRKGIKVFVIRVDDTCHSCTNGNFLGESVDQIDQAGFIKLKLNMNCLPPPHEPLFQANFGRNAAELVKHIRAAIPASARVCTGCGAAQQASARFCDECGLKTQAS